MAAVTQLLKFTPAENVFMDLSTESEVGSPAGAKAAIAAGVDARQPAPLAPGRPLPNCDADVVNSVPGALKEDAPPDVRFNVPSRVAEVTPCGSVVVSCACTF